MIYLLPIDFNQINFGRRALETTSFDLWLTQTLLAVGRVERVELLRAVARPRDGDPAAVGLKALSHVIPSGGGPAS
jgi:hypothetical protein